MNIDHMTGRFLLLLSSIVEMRGSVTGREVRVVSWTEIALLYSGPWVFVAGLRSLCYSRAPGRSLTIGEPT